LTLPFRPQHTPDALPVNRTTPSLADDVARTATIPPKARARTDDEGDRRPTSASSTLRDVAERSGVSVTTASRILNGRETGVPIREETRKRVLSAAADLGYKPNLLARGLRGSRSSLIGVIARDVSDPFHIQILQGINEVTRAREFRLFLGHVDYRPDVALTYGSMFERSHADGIIVVGDLVDGERTLADLTAQHRFVVGVSDRVGPGTFPGVYADSYEGTRLALEHLWDLGHRRIVCISDPATEDQRLRTSLYQAFMHEHGLGHLAVTHPIGQPDPEPSYRLGLELFGSGGRPLPTAVYATSDTIAIGLLRAAYQTGVAVPRQVSVIGFDNIAIAAYTVPPLTTVSQSGVEMGRRAAGLLLDIIEAGEVGDRPADVVLEPTLIVRDSTAPPAAPG
jgi:DNA-binding LacI/PurR family transcriptional regulator